MRHRSAGRDLDEAELVALRVGHDAPVHVVLMHVTAGDLGGAQRHERSGRCFDIGNGEVDVHPVLAGLAFRDSLVAGLNGATETRATVLRKVSEFAFLKDREYNTAFVTMEYFGYLRRDPDQSGFNFWLTKLNSFGGNFIESEMVKAFISSSEYRQRFGPM